jgi:hypothetical protein
MAAFLGQWGPSVAPGAGDAPLVDFAAQCEALLAAAPPIVSSVMGLYPPAFVARLKAAGIAWWANISTLAEARAAEEAGADAVVAQGMEAGGHRGCFVAGEAEAAMVGGLALIPAVADALAIPVIATGGIADGRGVAAALMLGASAVQIGTGFLRSPEAKLAPAWAAALAVTPPEGTAVTRAFSGRAGRGIATAYIRAASATDPRSASLRIATICSSLNLLCLMGSSPVRQGPFSQLISGTKFPGRSAPCWPHRRLVGRWVIEAEISPICDKCHVGFLYSPGPDFCTDVPCLRSGAVLQ